MSGHSKWATTHRQKGVADSKRGAIFTKLAKNISVAARSGGGEADTNFKLRLAIDQAKAVNMPKDNIERAIKRGTGELEGGKIEEITYEGFGPEGVAMIVLCLTDNRNRSAATIKHIFSEHGGNLGTPGSVAWMFEQKGVLHVPNISEDVELELIDFGVTDVLRGDNGTTVYCAPNDLKIVKEALEQRKLAVAYAEIEYVAKNTVTPSADTKTTLEKMFTELEDNEDVDNFYTNANL